MTALVVVTAMALAFSCLGAGLAVILFRRLAFVDRPGAEAHKQQKTAVPYGGGFAMAGGILAGLVAGFLVDQDLLARPISRPPLTPILTGATVLFLLGAWDDRRPLPALLKLTVQIAVALGVALWAGLRIDFLHVHGLAPLSFALVVLWCILITNAFNLLDHADGMSATVAVISVSVLLSASLMSGDLGLSALWLALIAVLAGFLVWNLPPARIYMGDAGALPLGFLIACGTLMVTFWPSGEPGHGTPWSVLSPLLITAIPLYDTGVVVVKRLRKRAPIMKGDRNHISHRLGRLGLSPRSTLACVAGLQIALAGSALLLREASAWETCLILAQSAGILIAVVLLEARRDPTV